MIPNSSQADQNTASSPSPSAAAAITTGSGIVGTKKPPLVGQTHLIRLTETKEPSKSEILIGQAIRGDPQALHNLTLVAGDSSASPVDRGLAIRYLAQTGTPELLPVIAQQLLAEKPEVRAAAYYSLPEKLRPAHYDYVAPPGAASRAAVTKLLGDIKTQAVK